MCEQIKRGRTSASSWRPALASIPSAQVEQHGAHKGAKWPSFRKTCGCRSAWTARLFAFPQCLAFSSETSSLPARTFLLSSGCVAAAAARSRCQRHMAFRGAKHSYKRQAHQSRRRPDKGGETNGVQDSPAVKTLPPRAAIAALVYARRGYSK